MAELESTLPGGRPILAELARAVDLRSLVERHTGVRIRPDQFPLLEARLAEFLGRRPELARALLLGEVGAAPDGQAAVEIAEALTNGETSFFRDPAMFEALRREVLPTLARSEGPVEIWCAACSTGQEPYSLAMLIATWFPALLESGRLRILASDVSRDKVAYARAATYTRAEINRGLSPAMFVRWFEPVLTGADAGGWRVRPELRELVVARSLNLLRPWPVLPRMDLILLRNAALYWSADERTRVFARVATQLAPGASLALGGAERLPEDLGLRRLRHGSWRLHRAPLPNPTTN